VKGESAVLAEHNRMTGAGAEGQWTIGARIAAVTCWMDAAKKATTHGPESEPRAVYGHKKFECARMSRRVNGQKHSQGPLLPSLPRKFLAARARESFVLYGRGSMARPGRRPFWMGAGWLSGLRERLPATARSGLCQYQYQHPSDLSGPLFPLHPARSGTRRRELGDNVLEIWCQLLGAFPPLAPTS